MSRPPYISYGHYFCFSSGAIIRLFKYHPSPIVSRVKAVSRKNIRLSSVQIERTYKTYAKMRSAAACQPNAVCIHWSVYMERRSPSNNTCNLMSPDHRGFTVPSTTISRRYSPHPYPPLITTLRSFLTCHTQNCPPKTLCVCHTPMRYIRLVLITGETCLTRAIGDWVLLRVRIEMLFLPYP
jgi:hypothetical protein